MLKLKAWKESLKGKYPARQSKIEEFRGAAFPDVEQF